MRYHRFMFFSYSDRRKLEKGGAYEKKNMLIRNDIGDGWNDVVISRVRKN